LFPNYFLKATGKDFHTTLLIQRERKRKVLAFLKRSGVLRNEAEK